MRKSTTFKGVAPVAANSKSESESGPESQPSQLNLSPDGEQIYWKARNRQNLIVVADEADEASNLRSLINANVTSSLKDAGA